MTFRPSDAATSLSTALPGSVPLHPDFASPGPGNTALQQRQPRVIFLCVAYLFLGPVEWQLRKGRGLLPVLSEPVAVPLLSFKGIASKAAAFTNNGFIRLKEVDSDLAEMDFLTPADLWPQL